MNRQEFVDALRTRLLDAGFPDDYVSKQCTALHNRLLELPDQNAESYTTEKNLDILMKKLIAQNGNLRKASEGKHEPEKAPASSAKADAAPAQAPAAQRKASPNGTSVRRDMPVISDSDVEVIETPSTGRAAKARKAAENPSSQYITCEHPKLLTALLGILCAPTIILLLGISFGVFAALFIALAAAILLIALAIIAIVGGGSVISLASLLYGATQLLSTAKYIGLHEVGFGLLVAGITMAASILLYNIAVRLIPYLFQKIAQLTKLFAKKLVGIAKNAVKGCEQL